ncbi:MAG TPA: glutaredoxin family protein [Polyangiaceae bacterium]
MTAAVTLYTRVHCHLCDVVKDLLDEVRAERPFDLTIVDVDTDRELVRLYGEEVPVVLIDGRKSFKLRVDPAALRAALDRAEGVPR